MYRDVVDLIEKAPGKLDLIMIPKVGTISDVYAVDMLCTQVEDAMGLEKKIGFAPKLGVFFLCAFAQFFWKK